MDFPATNGKLMQDGVVSEARASREALAAPSDYDVGPLYEEVKRRKQGSDRAVPSSKQNSSSARVLFLCFVYVSILGGCDSDSTRGGGQMDPAPGVYVLDDSVDLRISGRNDETVDAGDFYSDTTVVWSGDQIVGDEASVGDFRVTLPVHIEVTDSDSVTLNVEDIFGDNSFTWQHLESLSEQVRRVGGEFEVDMPVVIRVSDSQGILVDLEDVFGDNSFTWTVGTPAEDDATLEVGQIGGGVGGPLRIDMSVTVEVVDSEDVEVDVEDVVSDSRFAWVGGDQSAAAFVGGSMHFEVPLTFRVERSVGVRINLEDTVGDLTLDWTAGASEDIGGPIRFDVPTRFIVVGSRDVNIDFEDQAGDNIFTWTVDERDADVSELSSSVVAQTPAVFRVIDSQEVRLNSEDFFGDNWFAWTGQFPEDARTGLDGAVSASASATFQVEGSGGVNIDAEDVYGDNLYAWDPLDVDQTSPLPASVYEVVGNVTRDVVDSDSVIVEFANLNQGNRYLWGPPPELDQ